MQRLRFLLFAIIIAACVYPSEVLRAQPDISIQLFTPPPNQFKVADFWRIRLNNMSGETQKVFLRGIATEERDGFIVQARSKTFDIPPGFFSITARVIEPITVERSNNKYKSVLERTGNVPSGIYTVCSSVHLASTGEQLGEDCFEHSVEVLAPPVLVAPGDEEVVEESLPVFTWLPPVPASRGTRTQTTYRIIIAQMLGRQSPVDALLSNPAYFEQSNLPRTLLQYPVSSRKLLPGKYAWKVIASGNGFVIGESEVWQFEYKPALQLLAQDLKAVATLAPVIRPKLLQELLKSCLDN